MVIKNPTQFLIQAIKLPAAIEDKLPEGAPKLSTSLTEVANKLPVLPDFPMEIPDLPAVPELPEGPAGLRGLRRTYVTRADMVPVTTTSARMREIIPSPAVGVLPEVRTRRGL